MGWFSKAPKASTLDDIVKIVVSNTEAFIDSDSTNVEELSFFVKLPSARSHWRESALETCYEISQLKQIEQQALRSREILL